MKQYLVVIAMIISCGLTPSMAKGTFMEKLARLNPMMIDEVNISDDVPVEIIYDSQSPIRLASADVKDKGTSLLKMKGLEQAFTSRVFNNSGHTVMAYQLVWERHLPFEDYAKQDIRINNISSVRPGAEDTLEFRKPIHYRKDAFYKVFVAKVLLDDGTVWKSDRDFDVGGYWADIKKEIEAIDEGDKSVSKAVRIQEILEQNSDSAK